MSEEVKGFDFRTHIFDKTGKAEKVQNYKIRIKRTEGRMSESMIERPIDSGKWFYSNGEAVAKSDYKGTK